MAVHKEHTLEGMEHTTANYTPLYTCSVTQTPCYGEHPKRFRRERGGGILVFVLSLRIPRPFHDHLVQLVYLSQRLLTGPSLRVDLGKTDYRGPYVPFTVLSSTTRFCYLREYLVVDACRPKVAPPTKSM